MSRFFAKNDYYYAEWRDASRHPKRKTVALKTKQKRVAQKRFNYLASLYAEGKYDPWTDARPKDHVSLDEACSKFIESRRQADCTPKTIAIYTETLRLLGEALPPGSKLSGVKPRDVEKIVRKESLRSASQASYFRRLRTFFNWAVKQNMLKHSPMASLTPPKEAKKVPVYLTEAEAEKLLTCIEEDAGDREHGRHRDMQWLADFVRIALFTGLRRDEITNLQWGAVDLQTQFLIVRNTADFRTKSGHERRIPLVADALKVLERLEKQREDTCPNSYVFTNEAGKRLYSHFVTKRFRDYRREAGLPDGISVHTLRHTAASWLVQKGVSLPIVQEILGHSSITMTQRYAHLAPESLKGEMERAFGEFKMAEPFRLYSASGVHNPAETCRDMQIAKAA